MRRTKFLTIAAGIFLCSALSSHAQLSPSDKEKIRLINSYGKFDNWCVREIKESGAIGGKTKYLYEFFGNQDTLRTGKTPFTSPKDYLWRTNNVLAIVAGITKTNNTVFPEKRGEGYCARIETHIEDVKVIGIINMDVTCQGALLVGTLPEPIRDTKDPLGKVFYGIPFNGRPKALKFDYKADVGHEIIRGTGFSKLKPMGTPDYPIISIILQKRWEDEEGNIHALRVGQGIEIVKKNAPDWVNGHMVEVVYGNPTSNPSYSLNTTEDTALHALNSKGKNVIILEDGWASADEIPTHMIISFLSSCSKAFYGGVGNTLWIDNVEVVM